MAFHPPSCFGTIPNPEQCRFGKGGALKGPSILVCVLSEWRVSSKIDGFTRPDC